MLVKGVVLGQVEGNVLVKGTDDVLDDVKVIDEGEEDLTLDALWGGGSGAVAAIGGDLTANVGAGARVETWG